MDVTDVLSALVGGPKQSGRLLRLHTPLGPDVLVAETFDGVETLSPAVDATAGFRLQLAALSVDAHLDLAGLLGRPVLLELRAAALYTRSRPLHGQVTAFERVGSNGGLARYRLVIEPWLALLRQRVDSYVFQDMSVAEIIESVFDDYLPGNPAAANGVQGPLPSWRWDLADPRVYRKRSLTTQYEESDLAFVERLLAEEGVFYWFEHAGAPADDGLGVHTMVLADHNDAFADIGPVRFHRSDATECEDGIRQWSAARRWQTGRLQRASWDYRQLDRRPAEAEGVSADTVVAEDVDTAGPYAWPDRATGERLAHRQMQAVQVADDTIAGAGHWRELRPGSRFTLTGHPACGPDGDTFHCLRLHHHARNNLGAEVHTRIEQALGLVSLPMLALPGALGSNIDGPMGTPAHHHQRYRRQAFEGEGDAPADIYRNVFQAIPAAIAFRAQTVDGRGLRLHPKPGVAGTQSAIVVTDGAPVQTDRDHRIKIQFPWQRGANGTHRQPHPTGEDNAPGTGGAWTWVRVAAAWAGDNWGSVLVPRKGQEVLVAFLEGDIDRPVVIGSVYNGRGQPDAPHNQVGGGNAGATGNAPAWFAGNGHDAVFTGFKSQALSGSSTGSGGYQQLRLDDTPGQGRAEASTTQHETTLTLGHLKGGRDNVRGGERGFGVELSSRAGGALRAGAGLLLSTGRGNRQMEADDARAQLARSEQLLSSLAAAARTQGGGLAMEADVLPAQQSLQGLHDALAATQTGSAPGGGVAGGKGDVPGWSAPAIVASGADGIASVTPANQIWVAGTRATFSADKDLQWLSQAEAVISVAGGIALHSHGSPPRAGKPNQETGIALHAAQGVVSAKAHKNRAKLFALANVTLASTTANVQIAAPNKHLLATAAGAYIKLEGGNIELGAPETIEFKAARKVWVGPLNASPDFPDLPKTAGNYAQSFALYTLEGVALDGAQVTLFDPGQREILWSGAVDASGKTLLDVKPEMQSYMALVGFDGWSSGFEDMDTGYREEVASQAGDSEEDGREEEAKMQGDRGV